MDDHHPEVYRVAQKCLAKWYCHLELTRYLEVQLVLQFVAHLGEVAVLLKPVRLQHQLQCHTVSQSRYLISPTSFLLGGSAHNSNSMDIYTVNAKPPTDLNNLLSKC